MQGMILIQLNKDKNINKIYTLFLIDILYMKDINSVYGFKNGDLIIKQVYDLLKKIVNNDLKNIISNKIKFKLKHLYVDVFELKIKNDLSIQQIQQIQELISSSVLSHNFFIKKTSNISLNITIGCSKAKIKNLRIYAEKALHNAKLNYSAFSYLDPVYIKDKDSSFNLIEILNYNIKNNLVEPFFQKIVSCKNEKVHKYEALMRIYDKNGNILVPASFIQKSKRYRLYSNLMSILIEKTLTYINKFRIHVSINLDFTDILNPAITNLLMDTIKKYNIGKYLTIEILESEKITNYDLVNDFISEIKNYDVKIAIDDFGSGFSNYENILKLNIDYIKIDGSLIKKIDIEIYRNLISSIVYFTKSHDIKVIAEFVSDQKIFRYVKSLGIDYAQGYYFNKPQNIKEIMDIKNEK